MTSVHEGKTPGPGGAGAAAVGPGDVVGGKYRVERALGEGGMGYVVAATHLQLDERVALKFLRRDATKNTELMSRFAQEARAAAKIKSEHVARVYDVGALDDGTPFIVMEYLEGRDLESLLREGGPMRPEDVAEFGIQACAGLAEAHTAGIVHRDVKPENLFLVRRSDGSPVVKVLDFGISKLALAAQAGDPRRTTTLMGTPLYMSPEQIRSSGEVDARADVWSLGAVLFELLTGRAPFPAGSLPELCVMVLEQSAPRASSLRPDVWPELDEAIARCLAKDPADRFQNVADLAVALLPAAPRRARSIVERAAGTLQASGVRLGSVLPPSHFPPPLATTQPGATPPASSRGTDANVATSLITPRPADGRRRAAGIAAALVASAAAAGLLLVRLLAAPPPAPAAAPAVAAVAAVAPGADAAPGPLAPSAPPGEPSAAAAPPPAGASADAPAGDSARPIARIAPPRLARPVARPATPTAAATSRQPAESLDIRTNR